ncbi:adenlylate kinase, putative [Trichomonas vaginalis G3]|uniref:Adenlylate kinase, putative n=1 Tax=Trichomonas vaginalis (strain ATCC PRA-98 / G3) TaxID=412133 RepID=A2FYU1_TRIV3|nr:adenylate kinase protein [Trichomonas vaginalis G3]EAX89924.1 adenlylate kinase, putative [Trichomonas vaginalis G3]KAI5505392.1 adenylate kinase protein [Trichomonas vaginalis G3]|eukprot:XP_001302854.1 adenlylate kinase [Trichomonas vaginalis G3]
MATKRIIFFGPPGSGKGTQSEILEKKFGLAHISTGDCFRSEIAAGSPVGLKVKSIIESGLLVDDATVMEVFEAVLGKIPPEQGFILDGIPRTINQAKLLAELLEKIGRPVTHVIYLQVSREELQERICGRLFHPGSGRTYHTKFNPPKVPMKDDQTGEDLIVRKDDTIEVFNQRMNQYGNTFQPVLDYYTQLGLLKTVLGTGKQAKQVTEEVLAILQ